MVANPFKSASKAVAPVVNREPPSKNFWKPPGVDPGTRVRFPRVRRKRKPLVRYPLFPHPWKPKPAVVPFGKLPKKIVPAPKFWPKPMPKFPGWLTPGIMGGLLLYAWFNRNGEYAMPAGWTKCCDAGGPKEAMSGPTFGACDPGWCSVGLQVPSGEYGDPINITDPFHTIFWFGPYVNPEHTRMNYTETWTRPIHTGGFTPYTIEYIPGVMVPMPEPLLPMAPIFPGVVYEPVPWAPPISPVAPKPAWPFPDVTTDPGIDETPTVTGGPVVPPSITIDTDTYPETPVYPDIHVKEPPDTDGGEKEKKKRLTKSQTKTWLAALEASGTSYMELDDFTAAVYKALPWYLRRWRGRDGVWRDRDITTATRMERIYQYAGDINIGKMIENVASQEAADRVIGQIGQKLKEGAERLGNAGLWNTPMGFQYGQNKVNDTWDAMYEKLKKEAAKDVLAHTRTYRVKLYDAATNSWYWEERVRPVTQIPWFRQKSNYLGLARPGMAEYWDLTEQEKEDKTRTVQRYYYADRSTYNPIWFPDEKAS